MGFFKTRIVPLFRAKDSPQRVALAVAIGLFIGMTPTVGVQMAMVLMAAAIPGLKFNIPIACAAVWISNPFTMIPLYYGMYWLGVVLLNRQEMDFAKFKGILQEFITSIKEGESILKSFWEGLVGIFDIGMDIAIPMWVGGIAMGLCLAIPAYLATMYLYHRRLK